MSQVDQEGYKRLCCSNMDEVCRITDYNWHLQLDEALDRERLLSGELSTNDQLLMLCSKSMMNNNIVKYKLDDHTLLVEKIEENMVEYGIGRLVRDIRPYFVYTYVSDEDGILMEWIDGVTLSKYILVATVQEIVCILLQCVSALHMAYVKYRFVHHDLNLDNIIIQRLNQEISVPLADGRFIKTKLVARIIDFGFSRAMSGEYELYNDYIKGCPECRDNPLLDAYTLLMWCGSRGENIVMYKTLLDGILGKDKANYWDVQDTRFWQKLMSKRQVLKNGDYTHLKLFEMLLPLYKGDIDEYPIAVRESSNLVYTNKCSTVATYTKAEIERGIEKFNTMSERSIEFIVLCKRVSQMYGHLRRCIILDCGADEGIYITRSTALNLISELVEVAKRKNKSSYRAVELKLYAIINDKCS